MLRWARMQTGLKGRVASFPAPARDWDELLRPHSLLKERTFLYAPVMRMRSNGQRKRCNASSGSASTPNLSTRATKLL